MLFMKRVAFFALLIGLFTAAPAAAQPEGVSGLWEHYFAEQKRTVYLDLRPRVLVVWSVEDEGRCMRYPAVPNWEGDRIRRTVGADWRVQLNDTSLQVSFSDTTVTYQRSRSDPQALCQREDI